MRTTEFILKDGCIFRRDISDENLGSQDVILNNLVESPGVVVPHIKHHRFYGDMHLVAYKNMGVLGCRIPYLPFRAQMVMNADCTTLYMPNAQWFNITDGRPESLVIKDPWLAPAGAWFSFYLKFRIEHDVCYAEEPYIILRNKENMIVPFYPNIYDNGKVCMGAEWDDTKNKEPGLLDKFEYALNSFMSTNVSGHLINNSKLFLFQRSISKDGSSSTWNCPLRNDVKNLGLPASLSFVSALKSWL